MDRFANDVQAKDEVEAVARRSYGKLIAFLAARTRDVAAAEDALSEAFASALAEWPQSGTPTNPEAWLLTVARRKMIDAFRRQKSSESFSDDEKFAIKDLEVPADEDELPDRRLGSLFACAHPAIDSAIRAPLMLQVVLGLDARRISSAFLTSPVAMGKRLVRVKTKIRQAGIPFTTPRLEEIPSRLEAVLEAIYAAFTEGWSDPGGTDILRRDLTDEAIFLARLLVELLPREPESLGLLALMLHAQARRGARRNSQGEYVPLACQDTALWDLKMIDEAESLIRGASALHRSGRFQLEASVQSAHIYRCFTGNDNWADIVQLYDLLFALAPSPVVVLNRALAVAEVSGAEAALATLEAISSDSRIAEYQPYWARAELLVKADKHEKAHHAYEIAIGLERDPAVRTFLRRRQSALMRG
jgi:predicted RNA polymerase sigma factor